MSTRRTGDVHQPAEGTHKSSKAESSAIDADLSIEERYRLRLQLVPQARLIDIVTVLSTHDQADVRHATWDAIDAVSG